MPHSEDHTGLIGAFGTGALLAVDNEETGVVEVEVLNPLGQHLKPVDLGRSHGSDGRDPRLRMLGQLLSCTGGIVDGHGLELVPGQKAIALRKRLGVTYHFSHTLKPAAGRCKQVVAHPQVNLPHHVQVGLEQEVVGLVDTPGHCVLHRHHPAGSRSGGDRFEDFVKGGKPHWLGAPRDGERRLLAKCPGSTLVGDLLRHSQQYTGRMMRFLEGVVLKAAEDRAIVSLHGLGFEVFCPTGTLGRLRIGEVARLHTRLIVREDSLTLYGFHDSTLLEWFDLLVGVSGVGPRVALGILSTLPADLLGQAVTGDDPKLLTAAPGVGKKLAERIVLELKTKLPDHLAGLTPRAAPIENPAAAEAAAALIALGFRETQVHAVVQKLSVKQPEAGAEELIRLALRELR